MSQFQKNRTTQKSAKNINDAIEAALKELGVTADEADVEVIEEGSKGFLGIGAKDAVVKVTVKSAPKKEAKKEPKKEVKKEAVKVEKTESAPKKEEVKKEVNIENGDELCLAAKTFLSNLFSAMKLEVNINVSLDGDMMLINLDGDNMGIVIGKRGDTLDSIQYLTSLVVNQKSDDYIKVTIDTENYREKREEALITLSSRLADKVTKTGKKFTLEPMNPYERRIIHSNLQSSETVTTFSIGTEPYRKVVIAPKNAKTSRDRHDDRRYKKDAPKASKPATSASKVTYKADFKATPHKAEYKSYEEYLAAQNGEIVPPMNETEE